MDAHIFSSLKNIAWLVESNISLHIMETPYIDDLSQATRLMTFVSIY